MEHFHRLILAHEGLALQPIDFNRSLGNVVNVITAGNRRGGEQLEIDLTLYEELVALISQPLNQWDPAKWRDPATIANELQLAKIKVNIETLKPIIIKVVSALTGREVLMHDVGAKLADDLKADDSWETMYVHLPALGYARPSFRLIAPMNKGSESLSVFHCAPLASDWSEAIGRLVFHTSKHLFGPSFVPSASTVGVGGFTVNEKPWGPLLAMEHQAEGLLPIPLIIYLQGALVLPRVHKALLTAIFEAAYSLYPEEKESLDPFVKCFTDIWAYPLAPVLNAVTDSLQNASVKTEVGDHKLYFRASKLGIEDDILTLTS